MRDEIRMFSGLRSQWMTSREWSTASVCSTCRDGEPWSELVPAPPICSLGRGGELFEDDGSSGTPAAAVLLVGVGSDVVLVTEPGDCSEADIDGDSK